MNFTVSSKLTYQVEEPTSFIFNILAAKTLSQQILSESITIEPLLPYEQFMVPHNEARFIRMDVNEPITFTINYEAVVDVQHAIVPAATLMKPQKVLELPPEILIYLFPSRHCQSDQLTKLAHSEFGMYTDTYSKVLAINEWIFTHIEYLSGSTNATTSAYDKLTQREGVCKDFAHLGIALCRALDIPARYFTGYAFNLYPPDFHACYEAYIGGEWIFFDATRLAATNGMVKIANSRDASEVAVANIFGNASCTDMFVDCKADESFVMHLSAPGVTEAVSYQ